MGKLRNKPSFFQKLTDFFNLLLAGSDGGTLTTEVRRSCRAFFKKSVLSLTQALEFPSIYFMARINGP
jgi:hypothetical protein